MKDGKGKGIPPRVIVALECISWYNDDEWRQKNPRIGSIQDKSSEIILLYLLSEMDYDDSSNNDEEDPPAAMVKVPQPA